MQVQEETGVQIHSALGTQFLVENKWIVDFGRFMVKTPDQEPLFCRQNDCQTF